MYVIMKYFNTSPPQFNIEMQAVIPRQPIEIAAENRGKMNTVSRRCILAEL